MFKWAVLFLVLSVIAGALGLTNVSVIAKRVSIVLFALFFIAFLVLLGFAWLVAETLTASATPLPM
jgi:uncharacterized membrane protein YtjA (UPF0391 family)